MHGSLLVIMKVLMKLVILVASQKLTQNYLILQTAPLYCFILIIE